MKITKTQLKILIQEQIASSMIENRQLATAVSLDDPEANKNLFKVPGEK